MLLNVLDLGVETATDLIGLHSAVDTQLELVLAYGQCNRSAGRVLAGPIPQDSAVSSEWDDEPPAGN
jgi:hypothetical protein